ESEDIGNLGAFRPVGVDPGFSLDRSSDQRDKVDQLRQIVHAQTRYEVEPRRFLLKLQRINSVMVFEFRDYDAPLDESVRKFWALCIVLVALLAVLGDIDFISAICLPGWLSLLFM